jgi:hypothetical protein
MFLVVFVKEQNKLEPLDIVETDAIASLIINAFKNKNYEAFVFRGDTPNLELFSQALKQQKWANGLTSEQLHSQLCKLASNYQAEQIMYREVNANHIAKMLAFEGYGNLEAAKVLSHVLDEEKEIKVGQYVFGYNGRFYYDNSVVAIPIPDSVDYNPQIAPSVTMYPKHINPSEDTKKIWQYVNKNYKKEINDYETLPLQKKVDELETKMAEAIDKTELQKEIKLLRKEIEFKKENPDLAKRWIVTCLLYQRVCLKQRVTPWDNTRPLTHTESPDAMREKIIVDEKKAEHFIDVLFSRLTHDGLARKIGEQRLHSIVQEGDKYTIRIMRNLFLPSQVEPSEILKYMQDNYAFQKSKSMAKQRLTPLMELELEVYNDRIKIFVVFKLATVNAQTIVDSRENGPELIVRMKRLFNNWFEIGRLILRKKDLAALNG